MIWIASLTLAMTLLCVFSPSALADCTNPAGVAGQIVNNGDHNVPQYCDNNDNWIAMVGADKDSSVTCPPGYVSCGGKSSERLVFTGSGGGITGGSTDSQVDDACNSMAAAAGLHGTYLGWYSRSTSGSPASIFERSTVPYVKPNGVKVADDWDDLTDGTLDSALNIMEDNTTVATLQSSWTYTLTDGTFNSAATCTTGNAKGLTYATNSAWTISGNGASCANGGRPYCFEQRIEQTQIVPSGLVGHWRLDETGGATTATDSSGTGNNGILSTSSGDQNRKGMIGTAMRFNNNERLQVPQNATINDLNQVSISVWAYKPWAGGGQLAYKSGEFKIVGNPSQGWIQFGTQGGWDTTQGTWKSADGVLTENRFYHIVITYDQSSASNDPILYIDGQVQPWSAQDTNPTGSTTSSSNDLYIGNTDANAEWGSIIDDFRLYNRILTPAEVQELYEARDGIRYNQSHRDMEYFDGNKFVSMTPAFPDITSGLVGHWKLDETTGTTAYDSSGNGNDGTMQNGLDAANDSRHGAVSGSIAFDGIDDRIQDTSTLNLGTQNMTLSAWVYWSHQIDTGYHEQFIEHNRGGTNEYGLFKDNGGTFRCRWASNAASNYTVSPVVGRWYHVACTYDAASDTAVLYVNGQVDTTVNTTGASITTNSSIVSIGANGGGSQHMHGQIDDARIYNRALSANEVQALYNMGAPVGQNTALPQGCPSIGDTCDDGTVYAGLWLDGTTAMFTTPQDAGEIEWNNGTTNYTATGMTSAIDGNGNTATIVATDSDGTAGGFQPHNAAQTCYDLLSNGADDWYLPAQNELNLLYTNRAAIGGFELAGGEYGPPVPSWYWSSTEANINDAVLQRFEDGTTAGWNKSYAKSVRCLRKGPAPRCANPYGLEGQMIFNTSSNVVQYCDGARWLAIGKVN